MRGFAFGRLITTAALLLVAIAGGSPARAHQIESALNYLDGALELNSRFSNGQPAAGAVVRLLNPDGSPGPEIGRTNADGQVQLNFAGLNDGQYELQVDGGPGHRDYLEIPVSKGRVHLDDVVQGPLALVLVGLLVNVRARRR